MRMAAITNAEIARALREMALYLEMDDVPFKPRAYEKAALAVESLERPLCDIDAEGGAKALEGVPGIGKGIAHRIHEIVTTGHCEELQQLRHERPIDLLTLTAIEGLGPKGVKILYEALHVKTLDDLEAAARAGRIRGLPHFGERSEQRILHGIELRRSSSARLPLGIALPIARDIEKRLRKLAGASLVAIAGSIRRRRETIGDADFLVAAHDPALVADAFASFPEVAEVVAKGPTKTSVRLRVGLMADLRVVPEESWGAALCYFTGSKAHNVAMRKIAMARDLKLNEYGLFSGARAIAGRTEEEVFDALDMQYVPPELREDAGEIEAARAGQLPELIAYGSIRGDLQVQTDWTDGANSIEDMALAARRLGLEYIAITDHTRDLAMTRGCDEAKLRQQILEIRKLQRTLSGIRVLAGAEVNVRRDGTLDIADEVLAELDVVGVGVHSYFHLPAAEMTARIVRAIENPHVDILFHPTARSLAHRPPIDLDFDEILATARRTGTVLEIDSHPDRLDLRDELVRKTIASGVKIVIDSDAHRTSELRFIDDYGVAVARRAWATRGDVLNTLPCARFLACLKDGARAKRRRTAARAGGKRRTRRAT